jgi:hypothetical protein
MIALPDYQPPSTTRIKALQNEPDALRLLIAQRRLYRRAKRWLGVRWVGMVVIGIGAPVISVIEPDLAVAASGVAGAWLFLGRTWLLARQTAMTGQAAAIQEQFDVYVFGMPELASRTELPSLERIADISGPDKELSSVASNEKLTNWYPIEGDDGTVAVAIAQRANASYTDSLLKTTALVSSIIVAGWMIALPAISLIADLGLAEFLLGVVFPVLPAFLDVVLYVAGVRRSADEKRELAGTIEDHITGSEEARPQDLLVWQTQLFDLRRSAPEVPDLVYKLRRSKNERSMNTAARQLSKKAGRRKP